MRTYNCGHTGPDPNHMGRGAVRQRRLDAWFARSCRTCAEQRVREEYAKHTRIDGTPLTQQEQAPLVEKRLKQVARAYGDYSFCGIL